MESKWISVKDRLPKKNMEVLVCIDKGVIHATWNHRRLYGEFNEAYYGQELHVKINDRVTHWMPLPNPPQDEE